MNITYPLSNFIVSYKATNSSVSVKGPFSLTSSIFGGSSYNIKFNGSQKDKYYLILSIGKVSGSPYLKVSINGNYFYTIIPTSQETIKLSIPDINNGTNTLSIYNYVNGFSFGETINFNSVSLIQTSFINNSHFESVEIPSFSGIGNFYFYAIPIGIGAFGININGINLVNVTASDQPIDMLIPHNAVEKGLTLTSNSI